MPSSFHLLSAILLTLLCSTACTDYGLVKNLNPSGVPPDGEATDEPTPTEQQTPTDAPIVELPPCSQATFPNWFWWGGQPFGEQDAATDSAGRPHWDMNFDMVGFSTVGLPDQGHSPPGTDRVYRAEFDLEFVPAVLYLWMQSDDGLWFWANGQLVGHWGGDWQEEGCVNDDAGCTESTVVVPVDISDYMVEGRNVVSARVSNPVNNAFFDIYVACDN